MSQSMNYNYTPAIVLETMNKFTGAEFECKDGNVFEVPNSRRPLPERPKDNSMGRFCEAEKRTYRNLITDADSERLNYIVGLLPSELLCEELKRRDAKNKAVLSVVRQAIGI